MARARAICKCKYCGKEFEVIAFRNNRKDADSYEQWAVENIVQCPECREQERQKQREEEAMKNLEESNENGWPELKGTEKQIKWAITIRAEGMKAVAEKVRKDKLNEFWAYALKVMEEKNNASWWIDNRNFITQSIVKVIVAKEKDAAEEKMNDSAATTAEPVEKKHTGAVSIAIINEAVQAKYQKNDDFIAVVKALGFKWDGITWILKCGVTTGTAEERAAELGNNLLNAGFAIMIQDQEILKNAIDGNYTPRTFRWISKLMSEEKFSIQWGKDDDLYKAAKRLPHARYSSGRIEVPVSEADAVMDFAKTYDFKLTKGAQDVMDRIIKVVPAEVKKAEYCEENVKYILNTSREVLEDLKD